MQTVIKWFQPLAGVVVLHQPHPVHRPRLSIGQGRRMRHGPAGGPGGPTHGRQGLRMVRTTPQ